MIASGANADVSLTLHLNYSKVEMLLMCMHFAYYLEKCEVNDILNVFQLPDVQHDIHTIAVLEKRMSGHVPTPRNN